MSRIRKVQVRKTKTKKTKDTGPTAEMPEYKEAQPVFDPEEYEKKMTAIEKKIEEAMSPNPEEFVTNFNQLEGE